MGNLSLFDWGILVVSVVALRIFSLSTRSYMKGVADFLSANRSAGRYLLTIAQQMGGVGAISMLGEFEMFYNAGFSPIWWSMWSIPIFLIVVLTGWVFYRFRETRALTMAQFFEMRYSRRFRIFAGCVCFLSGVLNFGIFPAVSAHFFMYFCGIPEYYNFGILPFAIPMFPLIMLIDLGLALTFVTMGGQVSVMVTECVQGIFCSIAFMIIAAVVVSLFPWPKIVDALKMAPANASMLNPFHTGQVKDFNVWFFAIAAFSSFYNYMSWQGTQGFNSSARTPHEARMGGIIGMWRDIPRVFMVISLPIAVFAFMHLPEYAAKAAAVNATIDTISNPALRVQMTVPIALAHILPFGIKGLLATTVLFLSFTSMDSGMHSWGSIFVQDVVMPIRKRPLTPEQHIRLLRWAIIGVGIFALIFSMVFPIGTKLMMYGAITGTIWLGGSGAVIVCGLYWKRGTTAAAYTALIVGALLGTSGLILQAYYSDSLPINGQWLLFIGMTGSLLAYFIVSIFTGGLKKEYNLEKLLHRGKYTVASDDVVADEPQSKWLQIIGIREEFSFGDRILAIALIVWRMAWFSLVVVGTILAFIYHFNEDWFAKIWHILILAYLVIGVPATVWFTVGGIIDIRLLYKALGSAVRDSTDDGRVTSEPDRISSQAASGSASTVPELALDPATDNE